MKPPITFLQDDDELNQPYSTFDYWMGKVINLFAAIGMVTTAGIAPYIIEWLAGLS